MNEIPKEKLPKCIILGLDQWMFNVDWYKKEPIRRKGHWSRAHQHFPNFENVQKVYSKILFNELSYFESIENSLKSNNKIGLFAILNGSGMKSDGSHKYLNAKTKDKILSYEKKFSDTINRINEGKLRFEYGKYPRQQSFEDIIFILELLKSYELDVIAFFPPFANVVNDKIYSVRHKYDYIMKSSEQLKLIFKNFEYEFWDYSTPSTIKSNNDEFKDGYHAGELTHVKILLNMSENSSAIKKYINYDSLKNDIKNTKKNKFIIYD